MEWQLLSSLGAEQRRAVLAAAQRRRFARREVVFHEGDPGDTLHLVESGHVAVRIHTPLGDTATLRIISPGEYFGELAVIAPAPRNATIVALESTTTLALHRDHLNRLRTEHPAVEEVLLSAVVGEIRRLSSALVDALYVPVPTRLARILVELAKTYPGQGGAILIPLTQEDLAGLCGATRPTVNQLLQKLAERKIIDLARGKIAILDLAALERRAS